MATSVHRTVLVLLALLTACSGPPDYKRGDQRRVYRERDNRWSLSGHVGGGRQELSLGNSSDSQAVAVTRVQGEIGLARRNRFGVGGSLQIASTGGDFFDTEVVNNGFGTSPADGYYDEVDLFPHVWYRPASGRKVDVALRLGLMSRASYLDQVNAGVDTTWWTVGPRAAVDGEIRLAGSARRNMALFGSGAVSVGHTFIDQDRIADSEDFDSDGWGTRFEVGVRGTFNLGQVHLSFVWDQFDIDASGFDGGRQIDDLDSERWTVELGGGVKF